MAVQHALPTAGYGGIFSNVSQGYGGDETDSIYDADGCWLVPATKESSVPLIFQNDGAGFWVGRHYITIIVESGGVPMTTIPWTIYAEIVTDVTSDGPVYMPHVGESDVFADKYGRLRSEITINTTSGLAEFYDTTGLKGYPIYIWAQSASGYITPRLPVEYRIVT